MTEQQEDHEDSIFGKADDPIRFDALMDRSEEVIRNAFDLFRFLPASTDMTVLPGPSPLLATNDS